MLHDLRYSIRTLVKKPGFVAVAIITLALGIGANTAIFSIVNSVLLRPLPYAEDHRIVQVWETKPSQDVFQSTISPINFNDWREQSQTLEHIAAYQYEGYAMTGGDEPEMIVGISASANLLSVLGERPALGRTFAPGEDSPGNHRVALLSYGLWQRRFGGDASAVGQSITMDGESYTVIGVMGQGFEFPRPVDVWTPLAIDPGSISRGSRFLFAVGRLRPGVELKAAQAEMDAVASRLEREYPDDNAGIGVRLVTLRDQLVGKVKDRLWILLGVVGFVLLIACANVANLMLARAVTRHKEMAIRIALGASRFRLMRQSLADSLLLAIAGGAAGLLLAMWGIDLLVAASPADLPRVNEIKIDAAVLAFTLAVSLITGIIFGLAPAWQSTRPNLNEALKEGGRTAAGSGHRRLRNLFVVTEIALALVLLVGAGLLVRSFMKLQQVDPGFNARNLLTMNIALPPAKYAELGQQSDFFKQLLERVKSIEGVEAAGAVNDLPFSGSRTRSTFEIEGRAIGPGEDSPHADSREVSPDYFRAMGIPLTSGRHFTDADIKEGAGVVIINKALADRYWPGEDPLGKRVAMGGSRERKLYGKPLSREVVGVVGNLKHKELDGPLEPEMYVPYTQRPSIWMSLVVRGRNDSQSLLPAIRSAVASLDAGLPLSNVLMMEQRLARSIATERFNAALLAIFAAVALVLAAVGIYGVMSYTVTQATREIGIRMALGARASDVLRLVVGHGMTLALIGIAVGVVGALALTRVMQSLLFEVSATDAMTYVVIALILAGVALVACVVPARRATKVDPMVALRYE